MRILIAGATGGTGNRLARQLVDCGHRPIALVRESSDLSVLPDGCDTRAGDLADLPEDVARGVDAIVFAAGSGSGTSSEMTRLIDRDGAIALIDAAEEARVGRFVMLSSVGADASEDAPEGMTVYLAAKRAADDYLAAAQIDHVIVRPVALTDEDGNGTVTLGDTVDRKGEISRGDVAHVLRCALTMPGAGGRTFEVAAGDKPVEEAMSALE
ncbi:MAG: SDR family oxidoreductase [Pseudomonadota bacterium]